ncbi:MAG: hypothetical protein ACO3EP_09525, partial [Phycisphaerales bacterium]
MSAGEERHAGDGRHAEVGVSTCSLLLDRQCLVEHHVVVHHLVADECGPAAAGELSVGKPLEAAVRRALGVLPEALRCSIRGASAGRQGGCLCGIL